MRQVRSGHAPSAVTFPTTPLVSRVQIAPGADLTADPLTWPWADITDRVRFSPGVTKRYGRVEEATQVSTISANMKLDNTEGPFTRRNPLSPYFGLLSKNTPIWATVDAGSGEKTRLEAYVNEWPVRWADKSANDCTVTIQCAGVLRRLRQGRALKSALRRHAATLSPVAYWPLEDSSDAANASSGIAGGSLMNLLGEVTFDQTGPAGATGAPSMPDGGMTGEISGGSSSGWWVQFAALAVPPVGGLGSVVGRLYTDAAVQNLARFQVPGADLTGTTVVYVNDESGGPLFQLDYTAPDSWGTDFHHVGLLRYQSGANVVSELWVDGEVRDTDTSAGTLGAPVRMLLNQNFEVQDGAESFSHVIVGSGTSMPEGYYEAMLAYAGEQAHVRMARLCAEEGVVFETSAPRSDTMGPQPAAADLTTILAEAEAVGGGVLYEKRWGLAYQSLAERYNADVGMALDFALGQIAETPEPADDDQRLHNRWTVRRVDGGEDTAEKTSGPMGTGSEGPGIYDAQVTLNVEDDGGLGRQAGWRLHLSTVDEDRWPRIDVNFAHSPELIDTWCALPFGPRVTVDNPLDGMPPEQIDVVVEGGTEHWDSKTWTASLNASPASVYRVNVAGSTDGNLGRVEAASSTLEVDVDSVATEITVASPSALWRTGSVNFDINVSGERMTVTAIAGGTSPQDFTVVRSVNGVVKAQPALIGDRSVAVSLWNPAVVAL